MWTITCRKRASVVTPSPHQERRGGGYLSLPAVPSRALLSCSPVSRIPAAQKRIVWNCAPPLGKIRRVARHEPEQEGYRGLPGRSDRSKAAPFLAVDVEWGDGAPVTGVRTRGEAAFLANLGDDQLASQITRMTEENNVVVVESTVRVH